MRKTGVQQPRACARIRARARRGLDLAWPRGSPRRSGCVAGGQVPDAQAVLRDGPASGIVPEGSRLPDCHRPEESRATMPGPLHGYRIIDLTSNISGPLATMILADQGADVIKVEPPQGGDHTRASANRRGGFSASFLNNNRNKRSIALDLKTASAREAVLKLAATADVFIQNFRPGVVERMGLGEPAIRAVAPQHRLCLDQRLRPNRPLCGEARVRSGGAGAVQPGDDPGRFRYRAAAAGAHHPAGQAHRDHRVAGDHRGLAAPRAHRRGPARAALDAGRGAAVPVELATWPAKLLSATRSRSRKPPALST